MSLRERMHACDHLQSGHVGEHLGGSKEDIVRDGGCAREHCSKADGREDIRIVGLAQS